MSLKMSSSSSSSSSSLSDSVVPRFPESAEGFDDWVLVMRSFLQARGLWAVVQNGVRGMPSNIVYDSDGDEVETNFGQHVDSDGDDEFSEMLSKKLSFNQPDSFVSFEVKKEKKRHWIKF
jgi:hypothetical protein